MKAEQTLAKCSKGTNIPTHEETIEAMKEHAIEFARWIKEYEYEVDNRAQYSHTISELYKIFNDENNI